MSNRRYRAVRATGGGVSLTIEITATFENGHLTRDERERLIENTTSSIMQLVPGVTYMNVPLSKVRVTR